MATPKRRDSPNARRLDKQRLKNLLGAVNELEADVRPFKTRTPREGRPLTPATTAHLERIAATAHRAYRTAMILLGRDKGPLPFEREQ